MNCECSSTRLECCLAKAEVVGSSPITSSKIYNNEVTQVPTILLEKLKSDWIEARKAGAAGCSLSMRKGIILGGIISDINLSAKNAKQEASDEDVLKVVKQSYRGVTEAKEKATQANATPEQIDSYDFTLSCLKPYMPAEISRETTESSVMAAINGGAKNVGDVMKYIKANNLSADMKTASQIAKEVLTYL